MIELPWFGFSSFYSRLQIAGFISYMVDFASNEKSGKARNEQLISVFALFSNRLFLSELP